IDLQSTRHRLFVAIAVFWIIGVLFVTVRPIVAGPQPVVVTHWANGHVMSDSLLPACAKRLNAERHTVASGAPLEVRPVLANSGVIKDQLINRITLGGKLDQCAAVGCAEGRTLPDPVIVSPAADHWLPEVNQAVGSTIIDMEALQPLATTYIGIAMY